MKIVRYVGKSNRLPHGYRSAINGKSRTVISTLPSEGNVTVRFELDGRPLEVSPTPITHDFLDLCTLVYIADELEPRSRSRDHWSRHFDVIAPVQNPVTWEQNAAGFSHLLRTLAGDEYDFTWFRRGSLPSYGKHREVLPEGFDAVCLFSGGLDSFLGARQLLSAGKRVLLVGHQADPTAASAQTALAAWLRKKYPAALHLIQCRVARSQATNPSFALPKKVEETHRPRSLLFLALAVAIANSTGIKEIYLPENGLIAINPPLQKSRLGTLSTRTAHPRYLSELGEFLYNSRIYKGQITNPFLFVSKTDMLKGAPKYLASPLLRSVSCARPSRYKNFGVRHCGYCVPCIYRRMAMLENELDTSEDYAFDVFRRLLELPPLKQLDFRALAQFAVRILRSNPFEREMLVLSHGSFPLNVGERFGPHPADSYAIWANMLERWASDFLEKVVALAPKKVRLSLGLTSGMVTSR